MVTDNIIQRQVNQDAKQFLTSLYKPGELREVRVFGDGYTKIGFYDDIDSIVNVINIYKGKAQTYITLNPVNPKKLEPKPYKDPQRKPRIIPKNKLYVPPKDSGDSAGDDDITHLDKILIDFDPVKPKDQDKESATNQEKQFAKERFEKALDWLDLQSITKRNYMTDDSGNGYHITACVNLENTPEHRKLIQSVLKALSNKFTDDLVKVDVTTYNPSRITKPPGSMAIKGTNTPERPWRDSKFIYGPESLTPIDKAILETIAANVPQEQPRRTFNPYTGNKEKFDPRAKITEWGLNIVKEGQWNGATKLELDQCPFSDHPHHKNEAIITINAQGIPGFICQHEHCKGKRGWIELRELFEPGYRDYWVIHNGWVNYQANIGNHNHHETLNKDDEPKGEPDPQQIQINDLQHRDIVGNTMLAVIKRNHPPDLFNVNGELARVKVIGNRPVTQRHDENSFRGYLAAKCDFVKVTQEIDEDTGELITYKEAKPEIPRDIIQTILSLGTYPDIPDLEGSTQNPILRDDGTIFDKPGYDYQTRRLYIPAPGFKMRAVPDKPTFNEAIEAIETVKDIFKQFPWANLASRDNYMGMICTWVFRNLIKGLTPIAIISKNAPGVGGGLLTDCASYIATGEKAISLGMTKDEEKLQNNIDTALMSGNQNLIFDNVDIPVESEIFSRLSTLSLIPIRRMRQNENQTIIKNNIVWMMNGVNVDVKKHLQRRIYLSVLETDKVDPAESADYDYMLPGFVIENRGDVLSCLYTVARYWIQAGKPGCDIVMGSFQEWADTIGGMLKCVGLGNFMQNRDQVKASDVEYSQWQGFIKGTNEQFGADPVTCKEMATRLKTTPVYLQSLPDDVYRKDDVVDTRSLGNQIRAHSKRPFANGFGIFTPIKKAGEPVKKGNALCYIFTPWSKEIIADLKKRYGESDQDI